MRLAIPSETALLQGIESCYVTATRRGLGLKFDLRSRDKLRIAIATVRAAWVKGTMRGPLFARPHFLHTKII